MVNQIFRRVPAGAANCALSDPIILNVWLIVDFIFAVLSGSTTVASLIGLVLAGLVYALLPDYLPRGLIAGGVFAFCIIVGLIYELSFKPKNN